MNDEATNDEPQLNEDLEGTSIAFDVVEASCQQADADADDREDEPIDWDGVIETPARALTIDTMKGAVGKTFVVDLGHYQDEVELVEIEQQGDAADFGNGTSRVPFTAVFKDLTERTRLPEGTYRLTNDDVGEFEIHLSPEGANHNRLIASFC